MKKSKILVFIFFSALVSSSWGQSEKLVLQDSVFDNMMVRMAEIEIHPEYIDEYKAILKEESEASVRLEAGVICIYPMYQKDNPLQIRLLEIYADDEAYQSHLQTSHFQKYKTSTLKMVKSLKLIDMEAIDYKSMSKLFRKV
ncbi:putative quinol monooxygenase [Maribacter sp. MJ134]|uniref:putative quinol monooxygenase n=1 Tax=Maribacter sp. MJ134 TaxID=2496865 RepID=UPI001F49F578|nr:putative quinol monooxygenase [Maribacter sp. MJ134]